MLVCIGVVDVDVDELETGVVVERAPLEAAGLVDGEQAFDRAFACFGLAAE